MNRLLSVVAIACSLFVLADASMAQVTANFSFAGVKCEGKVITFTDQSTGNPNSYSWNFGAGADPQLATGQGPHNVKYNTAGQKSVNLSVSDGTNTDDTTRNLTINPNPTVTTNQDVINRCLGQNVQLGASATGGTTPYNYIWQPAQYVILQGQNPNVNPPKGSTIFEVMVQDAKNCRALDTTIVNLATRPTVNAGSDTAICEGDTILLNATSDGGSYSWSPATGLSNPAVNNPMAFPADTTMYILTVSDTGCNGKDTLTIFVKTCTDTTDTSGIYQPLLPESLIGVSPNPSTGRFVLELETPGFERFDLTIFDSKGRVARSQVQLSARQSHTLDLSRQPAGLYLIQVTSDKGIAQRPVLIK